MNMRQLCRTCRATYSRGCAHGRNRTTTLRLEQALPRLPVYSLRTLPPSCFVYPLLFLVSLSAATSSWRHAARSSDALGAAPIAGLRIVAWPTGRHKRRRLYTGSAVLATGAAQGVIREFETREGETPWLRVRIYIYGIACTESSVTGRVVPLPQLVTTTRDTWTTLFNWGRAATLSPCLAATIECRFEQAKGRRGIVPAGML